MHLCNRPIFDILKFFLALRLNLGKYVNEIIRQRYKIRGSSQHGVTNTQAEFSSLKNIFCFIHLSLGAKYRQRQVLSFNPFVSAAKNKRGISVVIWHHSGVFSFGICLSLLFL